jgi:hypothetical protein
VNPYGIYKICKLAATLRIEMFAIRNEIDSIENSWANVQEQASASGFHTIGQEIARIETRRSNLRLRISEANQLCKAADKMISEHVIYSAPGSGFSRVLSKTYSRKKYDAIFRQAIADMREEYFEALQAGNTKHAKWIWIRGICSIWMAVFADIPASAIKMTVKLWKAAQ